MHRNRQRESAPPSDPSSFLLGGGLLLIAQGIAVVSGLFVHIAAAHFLVPGEYNDFAVVVLIAIGFQRLLLGGVPFVLRRQLSLHPDSVRPAMRRAFILQLPFSIAACAALVLGALVARAIGSGDALLAALILTGIEVLVRTATFDLGIQAFNGLRAFGRQCLVASIYHLGRLVFVVAFLVNGFGLVGAVMALVMASVVSGILAVVLVSLAGPQSASPAALLQGKWWSRVRIALPFELLSFILYASNLWIVSWIITDELSAAVYAACFMISRVTLAVGVALGGSVFSNVAQFVAEGRSESARRLVSRVSDLMFVLFGVAIAFTYHFGGFFLQVVFGTNIAGNTEIFSILMAGMSSITLALFFGEVLGAVGSLRARLVVVIVVNAIGIPVTIAAVEAGGLWAGAWSLLAVGLAGTAGFSYSLAKQVGSVITLRTVLYATMIAGSAFVSFGFLKTLLSS